MLKTEAHFSTDAILYMNKEGPHVYVCYLENGQTTGGIVENRDFMQLATEYRLPIISYEGFQFAINFSYVDLIIPQGEGRLVFPIKANNIQAFALAQPPPKGIGLGCVVFKPVGDHQILLLTPCPAPVIDHAMQMFMTQRIEPGRAGGGFGRWSEALHAPEVR